MNAEQNHRRLPIVDGNRFNRRQVRKPSQETAHRSIAFCGVGYLGVFAKRDCAAPMILVGNFVDLKTRFGIFAKRGQFFSRQRMNVNIQAVENVIDRDHVRTTLAHAPQPSDPLFGKQRAGFILA